MGDMCWEDRYAAASVSEKKCRNNPEKKKKVSYSGQVSDLQVETDDENVPGHPHNQPGSVL